MQVYGNYNKEKIISEKTKKNCKNIYALTHSMCEDILKFTQILVILLIHL